MLASDPYLSRRPGLAAERVAAGLVARSRRESVEVHLTETASLLWLLCNGQERVTQIHDRVRTGAWQVAHLHDASLEHGAVAYHCSIYDRVVNECRIPGTDSLS